MISGNNTVFGIDVSRGGWLMAETNGQSFRFYLEDEISQLLDKVCSPYPVLVDMPIGLLSQKTLPLVQRPCDQRAREILAKKSSSIFSPPCMEALYAKSYQQACEINYRILGKKISIQSWNIAPRIKQINAFLHLNPAWREKLLEAHPEMAFQWLNGMQPLNHSKKTAEGITERMEILEKYFTDAPKYFEKAQKELKTKRAVQDDDIVDAMSLAVLIFVRKNNLLSITDETLMDETGNRMAIWL